MFADLNVEYPSSPSPHKRRGSSHSSELVIPDSIDNVIPDVLDETSILANVHQPGTINDVKNFMMGAVPN